MINNQARSAASIVCIVATALIFTTPAAAGDEQYDVVVYGATPAGLTAAVAAARAKASVTVLEPGRSRPGTENPVGEEPAP